MVAPLRHKSGSVIRPWVIVLASFTAFVESLRDSPADA